MFSMKNISSLYLSLISEIKGQIPILFVWQGCSVLSRGVSVYFALKSFLSHCISLC